MITITLLIILIGLSALYVAAEFSAVSASKPRLAQQAAEGNASAQHVLDLIDDTKGLDHYIAACQVGITLTSLIVGFYGQAQLTHVFASRIDRITESVPILGGLSADNVATFLVLALLTVITVVFGELIPKNLGVQMPERMVLLTLLPMRWSLWFFRPLIWLFNGSGILILRLFGVTSMPEHAHVHSPAEIQLLVEESSDGGVLARDERDLLVNTLGLRDVTARKVMIPRNHMLTADVNESPQKLLELLAGSRYSRLPLFDGTIDRIVGFVHLKDLLKLVHNVDDATLPTKRGVMRKHLRPVVIVPESIAVVGILESMQSNQHYLAIVADEYGGTAGMITVEDLFEEIIGEFYDEFDMNRQLVRIGGENRLFVRGDIQVDDLNEWLEFRLPDDDADTIGGLIFSQLGRLPTVGDVVSLLARHVEVYKEVVPGAERNSPEENSLEELVQLANIEPSDTNTMPIEETDSDRSLRRNALVDFRVEKMQDNSIREVSFHVTNDEIDLLHKHEIF